jgi:magnesium chelatase family protein
MDRRASVLSRAALGLETRLMQVECHLAGGLPGTTIVGLAGGAVREARDRVQSALSQHFAQTAFAAASPSQ